MISLVIKKWFQLTLCALTMTILGFCVSFILNTIRLFNLHIIRNEVIVVDIDRYVIQDLTQIFRKNVLPLIEERLYENLTNMLKKFFSSTSLIRYIIYLDYKGENYWSIHCTKSRVVPFLEPRTSFFVQYSQVVRSIEVERLSKVTNIVLDLYSDNLNIGLLILGLYPILNIVDLLQFELYRTIIILVLICCLVKLLNVLKTLT